MDIKEYSAEDVAGQPIGWWSSEAGRRVVAGLREALGVEGLGQAHWWTLNHVAAAPGTWGREALVERLASYDDLGTDFGGVFDDLVGRGWMTEEDGLLTLTPEGEAARLRARERNLRVHERAHEGIDEGDFVTAINVLRRIVANMGGNGDLPPR
ncbi:MarR family transcriptional regulator [Streptomyces coeruleoprunus]|uniref:MarR family transcriptional regulator n=1 Tax=Streptomyces coeruleoprunus TaxID=285563 RepID=A0ABV9XL13_9ACTN